MSSEDDKFESDFWGSCTHTLEEELKHFVYARLMGLQWKGSGPKLDNYGWDVEGKSVVDLGGGPTSMLLRTLNLKRGVVVDPLKFPSWVKDRYEANKIQQIVAPAEELSGFRHGLGEVWIYNVLQHVQDPAKIIANAKQIAPVLRIFEWIDLPVYPGHPHSLSKEKLEQWIGQPGQTCYLRESGCNGRAFYGVFTFPAAEPTPVDVL